MHGSAYDAWRDEYAYSPPTATRDALAGFVRAGGGLVALHTTSICFDDWPEWGRVVGGWWRWGESSHPPPAPVVARLDTSHPLATGLPPTLALDDEVYGGLGLADDLSIFGWARRDESDDDQPVLWTHAYGTGRVAYDAFGHDERSLTDPGHRAVIERALRWVGGG
jgi:type 1 glutamine amidotransferase